MNRDILNIIINDVLYNDINSIKKTSLISKNMYNSVSYLTTKNDIQQKLQLLQKCGHKLNKCIYQAAEEGYIDIVQLMFDKGALRDKLQYEKLNDTKLNYTIYFASKGGHHNIVQLMIVKGANNWNRAMYHAARRGHTNIIELLKQYQ